MKRRKIEKKEQKQATMFIQRQWKAETQLNRNENMLKMKEIEECKDMKGGKGRKKSKQVEGGRWKLDESKLNSKGTWSGMSATERLLLT